MASIAAVPTARKTVAILLASAAAVGAFGCGDSDPEPSIPLEDAEALAARIDEVRANVDVGSCTVAVDRTDSLIAEINGLPDEVDQDVQNALAEGANNLKDLLEDPDQCEPPEETTTEETQPTTTTQPAPPPPGPPGGSDGGSDGGSGGVGPEGFSP